jgi:methylmalonyl-CoA mutase, N-terminal domain
MPLKPLETRAPDSRIGAIGDERQPSAEALLSTVRRLAAEAGADPERDIGMPGAFPYTRGPYPEMYRSRLWTIRKYAGFGSAADTNKRFKSLLQQGQKGLSVAFDLPTQLGLDSDAPEAKDEVGRTGVAVDTLADMERIFDGIPIEQISTSMTINAPANILLAMYVAMAARRGIPADRLRCTLQNDIFKEYIARGNYIWPPQASLRMTADTIEWCERHAPQVNTANVSASHVRKAGAKSHEAVGYMFLGALAYLEEAQQRGCNVDRTSARMTFLIDADREFFPTIAKYRAARRIWAKLTRDHLKVSDPKGQMLRVHAASDCNSLTAEEPLNNIARIAVQALACVLGGIQSLDLPCYDEAFAIPTEQSSRVSMMIQHIIARETGVAKVADPLGGSRLVERMTLDFERRVYAVMEEVIALGGIGKCIETGLIQTRNAANAYEDLRRVESGDKVVIGVNRFRSSAPAMEPELFEHDSQTEARQVARLEAVRRKRDAAAVAHTMDVLRQQASASSQNLIPAILDCVKAEATIGEITSALTDAFGRYTEPPLH